MKRRAASILVLTFVCLSCSGLWAQSIADKVASDYASITSYRGTTVEVGLLPGGQAPLVTSVQYLRPWQLRVEVTAPAPHQGELFVYDGSTLTFWWPNDLFGIRIRGSEPPSVAELMRAMRATTRWSMDNYAFTYVGESRTAEVKAIRWKVAPRTRRPYLFPYESWTSARYSMPLRLVVRDQPDRIWYSMEFSSIEYGAPVPAAAFSFEFPANAVVFDWDLKDPGLPLETIRQQMNFALVVPRSLPSGYAVEKIIRGKHCLPMATFVLNRGGQRLWLTQVRRSAIAAEGPGLAVKLGGRDGRLRFLGAFTVIRWRQGSADLTLIGSLPYPEVVAAAAAIAGQG